jgi:hypothetical protein
MLPHCGGIKSYAPGKSLRTATPPGLYQYLFFSKAKKHFAIVEHSDRL